MEITSQILREIRDERDQSQKEFAAFLGISLRSYQNYEAGSRIPDAKKALIESKLNAKNAPSSKNNKSQAEALWVDFESFMLVPLIHHRAQAGFLSNYDDIEYIEELPKIPFEVDKEYRGRYLCFEVSGDSMNDGTYNSILEGDILLCREIQKVHWKNKLHLHSWSYYVIAHRDQGILVKEITEHKVDQGIIKLHSLNDMYDDQEVFMDDLIAIYNVVDIKRKPIKR